MHTAPQYLWWAAQRYAHTDLILMQEQSKCVVGALLLATCVALELHNQIWLVRGALLYVSSPVASGHDLQFVADCVFCRLRNARPELMCLELVSCRSLG